jgi:hypothetical protein
LPRKSPTLLGVGATLVVAQSGQAQGLPLRGEGEGGGEDAFSYAMGRRCLMGYSSYVKSLPFLINALSTPRDPAKCGCLSTDTRLNLKDTCSSPRQNAYGS